MTIIIISIIKNWSQNEMWQLCCILVAKVLLFLYIWRRNKTQRLLKSNIICFDLSVFNLEIRKTQDSCRKTLRIRWSRHFNSAWNTKSGLTRLWDTHPITKDTFSFSPEMSNKKEQFYFTDICWNHLLFLTRALQNRTADAPAGLLPTSPFGKPSFFSSYTWSNLTLFN